MTCQARLWDAIVRLISSQTPQNQSFIWKKKGFLYFNISKKAAIQKQDFVPVNFSPNILKFNQAQL